MERGLILLLSFTGPFTPENGLQPWYAVISLLLSPGKLTFELKTTEYFAYKMLSSYGTDSEIQSFVDKYDYYIFPVVNPDGRSRRGEYLILV